MLNKKNHLPIREAQPVSVDVLGLDLAGGRYLEPLQPRPQLLAVVVGDRLLVGVDPGPEHHGWVAGLFVIRPLERGLFQRVSYSELQGVSQKTLYTLGKTKL